MDERGFVFLKVGVPDFSEVKKAVLEIPNVKSADGLVDEEDFNFIVVIEGPAHINDKTIEKIREINVVKEVTYIRSMYILP